MKVNGRNVKFKYTIWASIQISKMCPEGKQENIAKIFEGSDEEIVHNVNEFMLTLNKAYIDAEKFANPDFNEKPLTLEELMFLDRKEYSQLQDEAIAAYYGDMKRETTTEPVKTKGKKTDAPEEVKK